MEVQLAEFYKKGENAITILGSLEVAEFKTEVREQREQLQKLVNGLAAENLELKRKMLDIENQNEQFKKRFDLLLELALTPDSIFNKDDLRELFERGLRQIDNDFQEKSKI